jgi:hypothetical protein
MPNLIVRTAQHRKKEPKKQRALVLCMLNRYHESAAALRLLQA